MFILVVILIGAIVAFVAYCKCDEYCRAKQFERLFKDLMEKLMEMGEDLYDLWEDEPFRTGEVRSRSSDGGLAQINMFLHHAYKKLDLYICFKSDLPGADTVRKLYNTSQDLIMGNSMLAEITSKCSFHELSTEQIAQEIHTAAELFRKSYPEIRAAKEKIEAEDSCADPETVKVELEKQAERIILKNFVAQFKKKKTGC